MPYTGSVSAAPGSIATGNQAAIQAMLYLLTSGGAAAAPGLTTDQDIALKAGEGPVRAEYAAGLYGLNGATANPYAQMLPAGGAGQGLLQGGGYRPGEYGQLGTTQQSSY